MGQRAGQAWKMRGGMGLWGLTLLAASCGAHGVGWGVATVLLAWAAAARQARRLHRRLGHLQRRLRDLQAPRRQLPVHHRAPLPTAAQQWAHDMRSPLAALEAVAARLPALEPRLHALLHEALGRLRAMATQLLGQPGPAPLRQQRLWPLLRAATAEQQLLQSRRGGPPIRLCGAPGARRLCARVAAAPLKQALIHLLENALQASDGEAPIVVHLGGHRRGIRIRLVDRGSGMSASLLRRVGELGFTRKADGHGLGVHAARRAIEAMGGALRLLSRPGVGTTATLWLPGPAAAPGGDSAALAALRSASF